MNKHLIHKNIRLGLAASACVLATACSQIPWSPESVGGDNAPSQTALPLPVPPPPPPAAAATPAPAAVAAALAAAPQESKEDTPRPVDLARPADDLWDRIRGGFAMDNLDSPLVGVRERWYAGQADYLKRMVERSKLYLYYIVEEVDKRGMPTEIALLPMVESAFNPMAYSRSHASGLWQFIPSTGKKHQLTQNWWAAARRDIIASTNAALDYLQSLYDLYGDWHLALASYNFGENGVARAIERNRVKGLPTDYQNLKAPSETRGYVPKLQALKNIIANPEAFGITLEPIPNEPYFATVPTPTAT